MGGKEGEEEAILVFWCSMLALSSAVLSISISHTHQGRATVAQMLDVYMCIPV